ncbi:MAG: hypothetical protein M1820_007997 [Bogoriella megaspora]|nr:MAG: hypothetical protein M1820_007997 [Bogoriella megaspora]
MAPPKLDGASLSKTETALLAAVIKYKLVSTAGISDWDKVAPAAGYKNANNAKTMFTRLCKGKLDNSGGAPGNQSPAGGVSKAAAGRTVSGPKKATDAGKDGKRGKPRKKVVEEEEDEDDADIKSENADNVKDENEEDGDDEMSLA